MALQTDGIDLIEKRIGLFMNKKMTVAVLFGGQSSEHEISCMSAVNVIEAMNPDKYELVLIGITKEGRWVFTDSIQQIKENTWRESPIQAFLLPDATEHGVLLMEGEKAEKKRVDAVFPVLHGMYGEDGTIQGLLEMADIPYVGCGVLSSAVSMDKAYTKQLVEPLGIRQAQYVLVTRMEMKDMAACVRRVEGKLNYPVFVKPSKAGSSKGVSQAKNAGELEMALTEAARHDIRILVEETIAGREIECAVLGAYEPEASGVGEILAADAFYSYEAKYFNNESRTVLEPEFPEGVMDQVRECAVKIFKAVDGFGLARVDFFLERGTNQIVFNEINTMPGFTGISMYPMLWAKRGLQGGKLIDRLIELALQRER